LKLKWQWLKQSNSCKLIHLPVNQ